MQADKSEQRAVTRLCIQCALYLLQHGAESALVEELSTRLGRALGMDSVESAISSNPLMRSCSPRLKTANVSPPRVKTAIAELTCMW